MTSPPDVVPVFPLPNAVLFPDTVLPLHIFEPRYRSMVRDASAGDGRIAIALLRPGWEESYEGRPAFHQVGTVGRIQDLQPLPDGRFNLELAGLQRVSFSELPSTKPYRLAGITPMEERGADENDPAIRQAKLELLASHTYLVQELSGGGASSIPLNDRLPLAAVVNSACANLPVEPAVRQSLLEIDRLVDRQRLALELVNKVLEKILELKHGPESGEGSVN